MRFMILCLLCVAISGCTYVFDHEAVQCSTDKDCLQFSGHPYCEANVCVASGLGPEGCFDGTPTKQQDYLNSCSISKYLPFDNCARLGLCQSTTPLPTTVDPVNPTIPAPMVTNPAPAGACKAIAGPVGYPDNIVYMFGANAFEPLFKVLQPTLSAGSPPYRAVFMSASACAGVTSQFDAAKRLMKDPVASPSAQWAHFYDDNGTLVNCNLEVAGTSIDIGVSSVAPTSCDPTYVPGASNTVADYLGPVSPQAFVVPAKSTEFAISAEAAHMMFGLGGQAGGGLRAPSPWTDINYYFIRSASSVSTIVPALFIGVSKSKFWGIDRISNENLRDSLLTSTAPNQSIGIMQMDYADKNRGNLRTLYVQSRGQATGYLPDSSPTLSDKANVRDGHYPLWAYLHFLTQLGPGGVPSQAAQALVLRFTVPKLEQQLIDGIIASSNVPLCAMKVARTTEMGDFTPNTGLQCGCYFDFKTNGKSSCQTCQQASECPAAQPACNYGFCEKN